VRSAKATYSDVGGVQATKPWIPGETRVQKAKPAVGDWNAEETF
jgi:hypothetical protein